MKAVPSAAAALAVAAPMALAGLPGPSVLTLGISGAGAPRAGHSYTYLVSVDDPARGPAWLVHLAISAPAGTTIIAAGGAGACRVGPGGADCVWPQLTGGLTVGVSVTVSLGSGLRVGASLAASARLSYDWGQLSDSATSVRTVTGPPRPKVKPKPRPRPKPTGTSRPRSVPSSPPRRLASSPPPRVAVTIPSPPSRVSPVSPPSQPALGSPSQPALGSPPQPALGSPPSAVRPHRVVAPSRTPRPRPSRSSSPLFPRAASKLIVPPPSLPAPGLPKGLLIALIIAPCVAAAVTRFARGR